MKTFFICMIGVLLAPLTQAQEATIPASSVKAYPVLFQQTAAEYRALCYQAFNMAALRLQEIPRRKLRKSKLAIITDLDETILDNSYSEAQLIKEGKEYSSQAWKQWTDRAAATAVPGAVEFLQAAKQKGISIFYISNRDTTEINSTLLNLRKLQLPDADTSHMLFLRNTSSKEVRRQQVMEQYEVVMLLGDNLTDFTTAFEVKGIGARNQATDAVKEEWGRRFIVLPNAIYGEWEKAMYDYDMRRTPADKEALRKSHLTGY
ncbi:5'-nucleotidase, lipoprotein e(P4) family [Paraflavitalea pollutisoli]|uniref:5'-nucleotidase, lipoprotein e(P4) family n=1 Tax=Paraflavitalea pollutisoli TaxID=3034143 RepID=UPI0023EAD80B|nr:5'-nucleotidase, lipoprotein e(P4) family [Paraflavitalea sp. H1-2-19X]